MQQHVNIKGLVLRETDFGDADRYITVLTEEGTKIEIFCRRARKAKQSTAARLFCFAEFTVYQTRGGKYQLTDAALITSFWGVTERLESYALCCYFAELAMQFGDTIETCPALTSLTLHALYVLSAHKRQEILVKAAYELRLLTECGYMPRLNGCSCCGKAPLQQALFCAKAGGICCLDCVPENQAGQDGYIPISQGALHAMQHAVSCELSKVFAFQLGEASLQLLARLSEEYLLYYVDTMPESLKFYHSLSQIPAITGANT